MAFWGIEVKPGKPFTLKFDDGVRKRLHISQATLAIGSTKHTSLVQCNVGDKSPVLLCALLPDVSESLQLNLEFDEDEDVIFSVIGPRGVHLTGFYIGAGRNFNGDESESYGEDIANSENEESVPQSDEDEYEDSFIDDDDNLEVFPPSPVSNGEVDDDIDKQRNKTNTKKRLEKRSQIVESDDESISWNLNTKNCIRSVVESDSDDGVPISSVRKNKKAAKEKSKGVADTADYSDPPDNEAKNSEGKTNKIDVDPGTNNLKSGAKPEKKRKQRSKEEKIPEANTDNHLKSFQEKKYLQPDTGANDMDQDSHVGKENHQRPINKIEAGSSNGSILPTVEEVSEKSQKKRRKKEQEQKMSADNDLVVPEIKADENTSEKPAKKKKRKNKVEKNDENMDVRVSLNGEKENSTNEGQEENVITGSSQVRTLSNGLVIEDLESSNSNGKPDGKVAAPGRKLKVQYTAKLKENGEIIDSNDKAPYRFRLGDEAVMEGWNIGLEGMRAGDKRRLVVPPSLGNGSKATVENVPPESWVIYEIELLSVR